MADTDPIDRMISEARRRKQRLPTSADRRRIREQAGVSLRQLGDALGVSGTAIHRWENGNNPRGGDVAERYARALHGLRKIT